MAGRERRGRRMVNEGILMEEWDGFFRGLLGVEGRVMRGTGRGVREDGEEDISREEINGVLGGLKNNKVVETDEIPAEVWKYGGTEVEEWVWKLCNRVWRGEGWIEDWSEGIIVPVVKKGEGTRVEEYRGVSLTPTLYKLYASVLAKRLREEVEGKGLFPQNQTGFKKGLGTLDRIFTY